MLLTGHVKLILGLRSGPRYTQKVRPETGKRTGDRKVLVGFDKGRCPGNVKDRGEGPCSRVIEKGTNQGRVGSPESILQWKSLSGGDRRDRVNLPEKLRDNVRKKVYIHSECCITDRWCDFAIDVLLSLGPTERVTTETT